MFVLCAWASYVPAFGFELTLLEILFDELKKCISPSKLNSKLYVYLTIYTYEFVNVVDDIVTILCEYV